MSTITIIIFSSIVYLMYHYTAFSFQAYIFNYNDEIKIKALVTGIINLAFWIIYFLNFSIKYEIIAMAIFVLLIFLQAKIFFKVRNVYALFVALTFPINLFAKRFIWVALVAAFTTKDIITAASVENLFLTLTISAAMSIFTIKSTKKILGRIYIDTILSDDKNLQFLVILEAIIYTSLMMFTNLFSASYISINIIIHIMLSAFFAGIAFFTGIVYAYHLADLRLHITKYKSITKDVLVQKEAITQLKIKAVTDELTGLYTRQKIDDEILEYSRMNKKYFVCTMDIDGLKYVNDTYGHDEGDIYINSIATLIQQHFAQEIVARYGGDEIVILGEYERESDVVNKAIKCFNAAQGLNKVLNKPYQTSLSYGIAYSKEVKTQKASKLIEISDMRMYEQKQENKKARK